MLTFSEYIFELLKENNTVIIPGFGAFISNYKPSEFRENEIKPPSKEISFSQQIRNNDGLLVGYVADKEKISHFDALKLIEKERENIIFLLDKGEKVNIEKTGELFMNDQNEIGLIPFQDENLLLDSFGLEPVSLTETEDIEVKGNAVETEELNTDVAVEQELPQEEEEVVADEQEKTGKEDSSIVVAEPETMDNTVTEEQELGHNQIEEEQVTESKEIEQVVAESTMMDEKEDSTEESAPAVESFSEPKKEFAFARAEQEEPKDKKKRRAWWFLLLLIPIIIAGFFVFNNQKFIRKNKVATSNEKSEVQKVPVIEPETVPIDSTQTKAEHEALAEEVKKDSIQSIEPGQEETKEVLVNFSPKFYLVAGGFKEEKNAETYLKELNEKGLEPFHMGLKDNFYLVGIGVYKSEAEAVRARREYAENHPGSGAWILEEE